MLSGRPGLALVVGIRPYDVAAVGAAEHHQAAVFELDHVWFLGFDGKHVHHVPALQPTDPVVVGIERVAHVPAVVAALLAQFHLERSDDASGRKLDQLVVVYEVVAREGSVVVLVGPGLAVVLRPPVVVVAVARHGVRPVDVGRQQVAVPEAKKARGSIGGAFVLGGLGEQHELGSPGLPLVLGIAGQDRALGVVGDVRQQQPAVSEQLDVAGHAPVAVAALGLLDHVNGLEAFLG